MEFVNFTNDYDGGIYNIVNLVNGKIYIGSTINFTDRFCSHLYGLRNNKHENSHLQASYNLHGEKNFIFKIIRIINTDDDIERTTIEQEFINEYLDKWDKCYNIVKNCIQRMNKGGYKLENRKPMSDETKEKISNIKKEFYKTIEGKMILEKFYYAKLGKSYEDLYGKEKAAEIKKKISDNKLIEMNKEYVKENLRQQLTGVSFEERFGIEKAKTTKEKMSKNRKGKVTGENHPRFTVVENIKLQAPDGIIYTRIEGISAFAKKHNLSYSSLYYLLKGKMRSHKNWRLVD